MRFFKCLMLSIGLLPLVVAADGDEKEAKETSEAAALEQTRKELAERRKELRNRGRQQTSGLPDGRFFVWRVRLGDELVTAPEGLRRPINIILRRGQLRGFGGVNRVRGKLEFVADGGIGEAGPFQITRMAGEESLMAYEAAFTAGLEGAKRWQLSETGVLDLLDAEGQALVVAHQGPMPSLQNDYFLRALNGEVSGDQEANAIRLKLDGEKLTCIAQTMQFSGTFNLAGNGELSQVGPFAITQVGDPEGQAPVLASAVLKTLNEAKKFKVASNGDLQLFGKDGEQVMILGMKRVRGEQEEDGEQEASEVDEEERDRLGEAAEVKEDAAAAKGDEVPAAVKDGGDDMPTRK